MIVTIDNRRRLALLADSVVEPHHTLLLLYSNETAAVVNGRRGEIKLYFYPTIVIDCNRVGRRPDSVTRRALSSSSLLTRCRRIVR